MLRVKTGMNGRSAKTAGYANMQSPCMAKSFHGKCYFLARNSISLHWEGSVYGCHQATLNNIIGYQHLNRLISKLQGYRITCTWLELMEHVCQLFNCQSKSPLLYKHTRLLEKSMVGEVHILIHACSCMFQGPDREVLVIKHF